MLLRQASVGLLLLLLVSVVGLLRWRLIVARLWCRCRLIIVLRRRVVIGTSWRRCRDWSWCILRLRLVLLRLLIAATSEVIQTELAGRNGTIELLIFIVDSGIFAILAVVQFIGAQWIGIVVGQCGWWHIDVTASWLEATLTCTVLNLAHLALIVNVTVFSIDFPIRILCFDFETLVCRLIAIGI